MSHPLTNATLGHLVIERPGRAKVFERWELDYCCGGDRPLGDACKQKGIDLQAVLDDLQALDAAGATETEIDWTKASLTELADHIEAAHHAYLREALPRLTFLIEKVVNAHGERHPELRDIQVIFAGLRTELEVHTGKEERILFPLCRLLDDAEMLPPFHCGSLRNPIYVMEIEHDNAGRALERLRILTHGFAPPKGACGTYRAMLDGLAELEADTHLHIHKENNILFPRALAREAALAAAGH